MSSKATPPKSERYSEHDRGRLHKRRDEILSKLQSLIVEKDSLRDRLSVASAALHQQEAAEIDAGVALTNFMVAQGVKNTDRFLATADVLGRKRVSAPMKPEDRAKSEVVVAAAKRVRALVSSQAAARAAIATGTKTRARLLSKLSRLDEAIRETRRQERVAVELLAATVPPAKESANAEGRDLAAQAPPILEPTSSRVPGTESASTAATKHFTYTDPDEVAKAADVEAEERDVPEIDLQDPLWESAPASKPAVSDRVAPAVTERYLKALRA